MRLLVVLMNRIRSLFLGDRLDADARAELRSHYEHQVDAYLASGMRLDEARRAAAIDVGGLPQLAEACREARGLVWWDTLRGDLRYAFRQIRTRPGFASAVILTVALGVGATTAVFAVVDPVVVEPLPYPESDRLFSVYEFNTRANVGRTRATPLNFLDWQQQTRAFSGLAAHIGNGFTLTGEGAAEFVLGQIVTPNLLDVLGVQPALGRGFMAHESQAGSHRVIVLTHGLWRRRFGGDPSVIGRTIVVNRQPHEVIGVLPPSFGYPNDTYELLVPLVTAGAAPGAPPINRNSRFLRVVGRLAAGTTEEAARQEMELIGRRLAEAYPDTNATVLVRIQDLKSDTVGESASDLVLVLASVAIVLLVACLNSAGLTIARGIARGRELAVRAAIGASSGRLVRQLATEGLVLFAIGGTVGAGLAAVGVPSLTAGLPANLPRLNEITVSWRLPAFAAVLTLLTGLVFSVLPALTIARRKRLDLAASRRTMSPSRSTQRARAGLIVAQIAAAVVLVAGAALAVRSFDRVQRTDTGFEADGAMTFGVVLNDVKYPAGADMRRFVARMTETLSATPAIEAVGLTTHLPLSAQNLENGFSVEGERTEPGREPPIAALRGVSERYRTAVGARLLRGRDLLPTDTADTSPVAVVTADFARRYITAPDALGVRIRIGGDGSDDPWRTIVGVIADIRHRALDAPARPEVWLPFAQMPDGFLTTWMRGVYVAARTTGDLEAATPAIRAAMASLDSEMPLLRIQPLEDLAHASTAGRRVGMYLLGSFAALALVLAAVGLFGVLAFHVAQHVPEFGVRLALGATPPRLLAIVLGRGLLLFAIGVAIGVPGALAAGRAMSSVLYEVTPGDPLSIGSAVIILAAVTLAACALPARRAMRTDPLVALRSE